MKQTVNAEAVRAARALTESNTGSIMHWKKTKKKKNNPFQKQSRAVTNSAPPNGCFYSAPRCTDRARHAPRSRGLRISLLSMAKMLMAHLIRHHRRLRRFRRSCTCGRLGAQSQPPPPPRRGTRSLWIMHSHSHPSQSVDVQEKGLQPSPQPSQPPTTPTDFKVL